MLTLNVAGAGKLGRTLAKLWSSHGVFEVQDVLTAHPESAAAAVVFIGAGRAAPSFAEMRTAQVWMLTPPDDRISEVCGKLAASQRLRSGDIVFHCSGSQSSGILAAARGVGASIASMHPVKSIAQPESAVESFTGTWCGVEGDAAALTTLKPAFERIGARPFAIDPAAKLVYHAASVLVCNYLPALIEAGTRCYEKAGIERATALQVMQPLVRETLENIFKLGAARALTGPIARGDYALVAHQLDALQRWDPQIAEIYRRLGEIAADLARAQGRVDSQGIADIEMKLAEHK